MATFNLKNKYIINKFNNAVEMVANHYGLEISICSTDSGYKYNYITVPGGLTDTDADADTEEDYQDKLLQIQNGEYSYLSPFYQIWMGEVDAGYLKYITEDTFKEINKVIGKLDGNKHKNIK